MRGENQAGPFFTIVNCVDAGMIALELDHCVFTSIIQMTVSLDAGTSFDLVYLKILY